MKEVTIKLTKEMLGEWDEIEYTFTHKQMQDLCSKWMSCVHGNILKTNPDWYHEKLGLLLCFVDGLTEMNINIKKGVDQEKDKEQPDKIDKISCLKERERETIRIKHETIVSDKDAEIATLRSQVAELQKSQAKPTGWVVPKLGDKVIMDTAKIGKVVGTCYWVDVETVDNEIISADLKNYSPTDSANHSPTPHRPGRMGSE